MKLTYENPTYGVTVLIDRPSGDDYTLSAVIEGLVRPVLVAAGYSQRNVDTVLIHDDELAVDEMNGAAGL